MIDREDSLSWLCSLGDCSIDLVYADPPYGLGSDVIVGVNGKPDYADAKDFMNKWDMPTGSYWESWFIECERVLKYGGRVLMYGMDRQLMLFKYYAISSGLRECQSLYWFFISNFPKSADMSKMIDRRLGIERKVIGSKVCSQKGVRIAEERGEIGAGAFGGSKEVDLSVSNSELGHKYEGYKYSIAPLKQTNETIMVFQKRYKSGRCLDDVLLLEGGDKECSCGALDIERNRVGFGTGCEVKDSGRYPAQCFIDSETAKVLDNQSGVLKTGKVGTQYQVKGVFGNGKNIENPFGGDIGACSKVLHKCDYDDDNYDIYIYCSKVSGKERNIGCEHLEKKGFSTDMTCIRECANCGKRTVDSESGQFACGCANPEPVMKEVNRQPCENNHPTLKPIELNWRILKLFKTPCEQLIAYPFAGAGSEIIGGLKAGFTNWIACELNEEYITIAEARIKHWSAELDVKKGLFE